MSRAGPTLKFLLAARQSELRDLEALAHTCSFVTLASELVHALQKERGWSNLYLCHARDGQRATLDALSDQAQARERDLRLFLDGMDCGREGGKARLYNRIAHALYCLEELPELRSRLRQQRIDAPQASAAFTRLIAHLLAVVFEAADTALDADITRVLVALLNFMQGKELAGQERAHGVMGYTAGHFDAAQKARMTELAADQERSFESFERHAPAAIQQAWRQARQHEAPVARLRAMAALTDESHTLDPDLAELWFDLCTVRIDAMLPIAASLTQDLAARCRARIGQAREALHDHRPRPGRLDAALAPPAMLFSVQGRALEQPAADAVGPSMERSLLDTLQAQTEQLHKAGEALAQARGALDEQRDIQRAKHLLMTRGQLSEPAAHAQLQQAAMQTGRPLAEIARHLLKTHRS
ncbi:nitrate regulatory protein [Bordetella hinzii]|uniref:nitrate regulatory protein n=1 Tax=Bordetella hinzii TaxID=103855 RepID=UPI0011520203|nr:nitrate- and nitrite sensing domain-containing protein [Bordetella hinzii]QDJ32766.1 hypothetical protein CBR68_10780 [Bordetella hinzii]